MTDDKLVEEVQRKFKEWQSKKYKMLGIVDFDSCEKKIAELAIEAGRQAERDNAFEMVNRAKAEGFQQALKEVEDNHFIKVLMYRQFQEFKEKALKERKG